MLVMQGCDSIHRVGLLRISTSEAPDCATVIGLLTEAQSRVCRSRFRTLVLGCLVSCIKNSQNSDVVVLHPIDAHLPNWSCSYLDIYRILELGLVILIYHKPFPSILEFVYLPHLLISMRSKCMTRGRQTPGIEIGSHVQLPMWGVLCLHSRPLSQIEVPSQATAQFSRPTTTT